MLSIKHFLYFIGLCYGRTQFFLMLTSGNIMANVAYDCGHAKPKDWFSCADTKTGQ